MDATDFLHALQECYTVIDGEMTECGVACKRCTACCNPQGEWFAPQPSLLEVDLIRRHLRSKRHAWPETEKDDACQFLKESTCKVYEVRPFHCRTFSCGSEALQVYLRRKAEVEKLCADYAHMRGKPFSAYPFSMYSVVSQPDNQGWLDVT